MTSQSLLDAEAKIEREDRIRTAAVACAKTLPLGVSQFSSAVIEIEHALIAVAKQAAKEERETCAKVADAYQETALGAVERLPSSAPARKWWEEGSIAAAHVAEDIRARSTR